MWSWDIVLYRSSCYSQNVNLDKNAGLQTVINDLIFLRNYNMNALFCEGLGPTDTWLR